MRAYMCAYMCMCTYVDVITCILSEKIKAVYISAGKLKKERRQKYPIAACSKSMYTLSNRAVGG